MNKKVLYVVIAVVVVGVIVWLAFSSKSGPGGTPVASPQPAGGSSPMQSLRDLLASGAPQTCSFSSSAANGGASGQIYVSGGHMRGDFTATAGSGQTVTSHMITDGQTAKMWSSQMPQGIKMAFSAVGGQGSQAGGVNPDAKANYSCSPWSGDPSEFVPPAGITFTDMSAMMQGALPGGPSGATLPKSSTGPNYNPPSGGASAQCAQCNIIPDASAKAQCLSALHCQ